MITLQQQQLQHQYVHIAHLKHRHTKEYVHHYYRQPQDKFVVESWELSNHLKRHLLRDKKIIRQQTPHE